MAIITTILHGLVSARKGVNATVSFHVSYHSKYLEEPRAKSHKDSTPLEKLEEEWEPDSKVKELFIVAT